MKVMATVDTRDWIEQTFECRDADTGRVFVVSSAPAVTADLEWFVSRFGHFPAPPTCAALKSVDPDNAMGWHRHFDAWVEQGIIAAE